MGQPTRGKLAKQRNYCLAELDKHDLSDRRRKILQAKLLHITEQLRVAGACRECGRTLSDPASVARGVGPECQARLVGAVA